LGKEEERKEASGGRREHRGKERKKKRQDGEQARGVKEIVVIGDIGKWSLAPCSSPRLVWF